MGGMVTHLHLITVAEGKFVLQAATLPVVKEARVYDSGPEFAHSRPISCMGKFIETSSAL